MSDLILLAGATGDLGARIAKALVQRGATVRAVVRPGTAEDRLAPLRAQGVEIVPVDFADGPALTEACRGAACVVSALSGLEPVIVDAQTRLLDAAVAAGVPRFIASDYSIDYTALPTGSNRNFDLRRRFRERLDAAPIRATSIFNGAFADMLAGQMPLIVRPIGRVLYWQDADRCFALTTKDDTAAYTAAAALDASAPRDLHIAGSETSSRDLAGVMTEITGKRYKVARAGSLSASPASSASFVACSRRRTRCSPPGRECSISTTCSATSRPPPRPTTTAIRGCAGRRYATCWRGSSAVLLAAPAFVTGASADSAKPSPARSASPREG